MACAVQNHHERLKKMIFLLSYKIIATIYFHSFTFDYINVDTQQEEVKQWPRMAGRRTHSNPLSIQLHVVFEKEGDTNWPISVKVTIKQNNEKEICLNEVIWRLKEHNLNDYLDSSVSYFH